MMNKPRFFHASDYAGLEFKNGDFYYGYEHSICTECGNTNKGEFCDSCEDVDREWCFVAAFNDEKIIIPFSKLGAKDMFNVIDCLNTGIGWILAKYTLGERP
jgi:hypothetical protein